MVDNIKIQIGLTGDDEIKRQLAATATTFAQATASISQLGNTMTEALEGASAAAKKFGASANELAGVESRIRAVAARAKDSSTSFAELTANIDRAKTSSTAAAAASDQHGQALQQTTTHAVSTRTEIQALATVLRELGAGSAATLVSSLGRTELAFGALAAAALAAGVAVKGAFDAAKNAAENAHGLEQLAAVSGQSAEQLSALQVVFAKGGVSAQQFNSEFTNLALNIKEKAAAIAEEVKAAADKITTAQLRVREAFLNVQRVQLQGAQTKLQLQGVQQQLAVLGQVQSVERQRAQIAVGDARARLQSLVLQKQLRDGTISEEEFAERMADIEAGSLAREIQKAKLDVEAAERAASALPQQQQMQEKQLQLQEQSLRLQQEANQIARERAEIEVRSAGRNLAQETANDLRAVIQAARDIQNGLRTAFDPLTTAENKVKALIAALGEAKDPIAALADIMKNLGSPADRLNLGKALGLDANTVEVLSKGSVALNAIAEAVKAAGQSLTAADFTKLRDLRDVLNQNAAATTAFAAAVASFSSDKFVIAIDAMTAALTRLNAARGKPSAETPTPQLGDPNLGIPFASGGLVRGLGGVDTNLAWLSNLEYVMRPAAVKKYGVNFMHTINSMQFPGFATGGLNLTVPANVGGGSTGGSNVTIQFPGLPPIGGLRASSDVVDELHRAAALAQVRSGGRKPSRYS